MEERYIRNLGALTEDECALLRRKTILVAGCGGLGGHIIDNLLRLGVGCIIAADGDVFERSNLNRQLLSDESNIGTGKAASAQAYAERVNPQLRFIAVAEFISEENVTRLIQSCDAVIDALDNISSRKLLRAACAKADIPYIYGAICGWVAQTAVITKGCELLDRLYSDETVLENKSALSFTPALCAAMQTALCVKLLCGRPIEEGKLYYFDLLDFELETIL